MAQFPGIATKAVPAGTDGLLIDDQADSGNAKRSPVNSLPVATSQISGNFTDLVLANNISQNANTNNTISANAVTIDLSANNHQSLDLAAATGAVTVTLTAPDGACGGSIVIKQDATARDISWVAGTGITTGYWLGTEPTWSGDTAEKRRIVAWRFDGTDIYLAVTDEETATF